MIEDRALAPSKIEKGRLTLRDPGRVAASIGLLRRYRDRPQPISVLMSDWGRSARYAGAKDRAFVRGLALDTLRRWRSFGGKGSVRGAVMLTLRETWRWESQRIAEAFSGEHGDGKLTKEELALRPSAEPDLPEVALPHLADPDAVSAAMRVRAPVDLRVNLLKANREKALKALRQLGAEETALSPLGIRVPPPPSAERGPGVTVIPAYGKGWVEVQDEGSQLTVLALGDLAGQQVVDYCAGGGGKTLALAGHMHNSGQIFAYDRDAGRLAPIHDRLRRAGVRNVQVIAPGDEARLDALAGQAGLVFVDAPCSGSGTWRRHPDQKWRLTEDHLAARMGEQDSILRSAAKLVKPGGRMAYVTCSLFASENEDRAEHFLAENQSFSCIDPLSAAPPHLASALTAFVDGRALRLAPQTSGTDGFTLHLLRRDG